MPNSPSHLTSGLSPEPGTEVRRRGHGAEHSSRFQPMTNGVALPTPWSSLSPGLGETSVPSSLLGPDAPSVGLAVWQSPPSPSWTAPPSQACLTLVSRPLLTRPVPFRNGLRLVQVLLP